ncbi:peptidoglycan DD-metalloendopeptidase family protein [Campylobacter sp. RM12327]|uniref:murein hydrolase activator EnvC family protein n=1 Tax=Campylobacter sputorum TaxID=206 RepID=UPI000B7700A2|nr:MULTISPECIES: M23 family metallopeptidase [Campylobacter]ASM40234.1 zinc metallopeptidase, M23 family [Campylobacter sputorum]MBE7358522.1 peptidoglycan DD-metalloendopeptidase family protein [Campylobacter sp. RM11302]MBF6669765.1 peptidoglycan DD-metalloendopeptidase family protein [Campylobacter sp. RM12327]MBF6674947.1 peptidoglycan DD-metalloendopeptidase family protein [Campylobacter sp. RM13538]MBF6676353.1 peptidoglycan DD-metalloendopeptidase family protein [Campylobacter sp. RM123
MKKAIFLFFAVFICFCAAATSTKDKIADKSNTLKSTQELEKSLNKKLEELASDIVVGEKNIALTDDQIKKLENQVEELKQKSTLELSELDKLTKQNSDLIRSKQNMEEMMIRIIAENFSFDLLSADHIEESEESIISREIVLNLSKDMKSKFEQLAKNYEETTNLIKTQNSKINNIKNSLKEYEDKKNELTITRKKRSDALEKSKKDKDIYLSRLTKLQAQQDELRKTLEKLKILSAKEDEEKKRKQEKESLKSAKSKNSPDNDIRIVGSSYKKGDVKKYTGSKTIAPLENFTVKQKFGNYVDSVYNIKIFNESVVLSSNEPNAKVRSVLAGRVVFAKNTSVLDNVVIIENPNGIHTIYAHLSQIAPTISVGSKVSKGYTIGRVRRDLTFEVTQQNYHIDPLEMISF